MLSQRTRYTIRALQHLADHYGQGPIQLTEIATAQNIPGKFLTVILSEMSRAGLVATMRGKDGGYWLALSPVDVSYGDIVRITILPLCEILFGRMWRSACGSAWPATGWPWQLQLLPG